MLDASLLLDPVAFAVTLVFVLHRLNRIEQKLDELSEKVVGVVERLGRVEGRVNGIMYSDRRCA